MTAPAAPAPAAAPGLDCEPLWDVLWMDPEGSHSREVGGRTAADAAWTVAVSLPPSGCAVLLDVVRLR